MGSGRTWLTRLQVGLHSSGAMYPGVPRRLVSAVPDSSTFSARPMSDTFAITFRPSKDSNTLPGFRSQCTKPESWIACMPARTPRAICDRMT